MFTVTLVQAQVKISVVPGKTVVRQNESFQLQFVVEGTTEVDEFIPPAFRNFEQLSSFEQANGWTWVNGSLSEYVSYTVVLRPKIKGRLPIASAVIKTKGKVVSSAPLVIFVTNASDDGKTANSAEEERPDYYLLPGENIKEKIAKNLFVKATVDKHSCYIGEPVLATFKLFTRLDSESKILKRPSLNGFSVVDLEEPEAGNFSKEMLNGKWYNCYLIRKVQLFPLQTGVLTIEPVEVENIVRMIKAKNISSRETSNWLDAMMEKMKESDVNGDDIVREKMVMKSEEMKINVLELPEKNKPESFNGAVGQFTMKAGLLSKQIAVNDNGVLRITIKGKGNIPMITVPSVSWPAGIDSFDMKLSEDIDKTTSPVSGTKTFDLPFSVSKTGVVKIPSLRFSYFDEKKKSYETITTDTLQLRVTNANRRKKIVPTVEQQTVTGNRTGELVWFAGGASLVLLAGGLFFFVKRNNRTAEEQKAAAIKQVTEEAVYKKTVADFLQPADFVLDGLHHKQFYTLLMEGMQQYFADRLQLHTNNFSGNTIIEMLKQKQCTDLAERYQQMISDCEMIIFSGISVNDSRAEMLLAARSLLTEADSRL